MTEPDRREHALRAFLAAQGWGMATRAKLAGDASFRRYQRVSANGRRAVLMDAPPPKEDVRRFVRIARHLVAQGLSAPKVLAEHAGEGFLLLEDLGDDTYTRTLDAGADANLLYAAAIDLLADLQRRPPPPGVPAYDDTTFLAESDLLIDWFLPAVADQITPDDLRPDYHRAWRLALPLARTGQDVLVLRDYHADNLMWLPTRAGIARVGLLDFQDARVGPRAYDLVSLLEDARRKVAPSLVEAMIARYLAAFPDLDAAGLGAAYAVLGAQRNAKIIGIFTRLSRRDRKHGYLDMIPRVWRLLEGDLAHPALAPVRAWFDQAVPPALRRAPTPP
jgi:hypothetical protein